MRMEKFKSKAKKASVFAFKNFGWLCLALLVASMGTRSQSLAGAVFAGLAIWGMACSYPKCSRTIKKWAIGTREPKATLLNRMAARQGKAFKKLSPIDQAMAARADLTMQRRFWWECAAVMWMKANQGAEHEWSGLIAAPGWFDDAKAWLTETVDKLEDAADRGWICPNLKVAELLCQPEKVNSNQELGDAIEMFAKLGETWPGKARYSDTIASMGHKLYDLSFSESLAWRSHGALERMKIRDDMESLGGKNLRAGRKLRL